MSRTIVEESDGTVTLGTGWASAADTYASGGNYAFALASGKLLTITRTTASGFTGFLVAFSGRADSTRNATIQIDGGTVQPLDQGGIQTAGSVDQNLTVYRQCAGPFFLPTNGAHTIIITSGTGTTTFDRIEWFTAVTTPALEANVWGHSVARGVTSGTDGTQISGRLSLLQARYFGWTEVNQGIPGEDLTNGDYHSASPFLLTRYYNQGTIYTPGWMRAESGNLWPSPGPAMGGSALMTTAQTGALGPQLWARASAVTSIVHGLNDGGYSERDITGHGIGAGNQNASLVATHPATTLTAYQTASQMQNGYGGMLFKQRYRELIMRNMLNNPNGETWCFGIAPVFSIDPAPFAYYPSYNTLADLSTVSARYVWWQYQEMIRAVVAESWTRNTYFVDCLQAFTGKGGPLLLGPDIAHPNNEGNMVMFQEWKRQYEQVHSRPAIAASRVA